MIRHRVKCTLFILLWTMLLRETASAVNVWLSLNLQFNLAGKIDSGGTWTVIAKTDAQGLAGVNMYLSNATTFGSFLSPPELDTRQQSLLSNARNIVIIDDLSLPLPLDIGVIGGSFPSTYVDPAGIIPYANYPSYGSFTGGVALATGLFGTGVVPDWAVVGNKVTDANVFIGTILPPSDANTLMTVRAAPGAGDYNSNGVVDAADYVVWRHGIGGGFAAGDYGVWRSNFARSSISGFGSITVPEPENMLFVLCTTGVGVFNRSRRTSPKRVFTAAGATLTCSRYGTSFEIRVGVANVPALFVC